MTSPWAGERVVDVEAASRLVRRAFPFLEGQPVTALAEGWDSAVFTVGDDWVFRFPRRAAVLPGLRREIAVLPRLCDLVPLAIPVPELVAADHHPQDPWPFVGCRFIPGVELVEAELSAADRVPVGAVVGRFLAALHATDVSSLAGELVVDPNGRGNPAGAVDYLRSLLDSLRSGGLLRLDAPASARVDDLVRSAGALPAPPGTPVVVHGDLHARHILVGASGAATGIIDWVDVCLADPAVDLSIAFSAFAGPARHALLTAYGASGRLDPDRELRARALALKLSAMLAAYAADLRAEPLLSEALAGIARSVSDA